MYRLIVWAVILLPFALLAPASTAQGQWDRGYDRGYGGYGTYQDTCTDAHWDGSMLFARCQKKDGGWRNTSIDARNCGGQILNLDGHLSCGEANNGYQQPPYANQGYGNPYGNRPVYGNWQGGLPPGDYQLTCQNMRVDGNRLSASCEKRNGSWRNTSLDFDNCRSPIVNDNGRLRCTKD